jgi:hypothetical protein
MMRALLTLWFRSSIRKMPRSPVVPELVNTRYLPSNRCPTRTGRLMKARACSMVTSGSVTQSSNRVINAFFMVTGSSVWSSTWCGRCW